MSNNGIFQDSMLKKQKEEEGEVYFRLLPPGYRFKPRDDELVNYYLRLKLSGLPLPPNIIREVNLYRYDPETLTARNNHISSNEVGKEWYFFTPRERKYTNGSRPARKAGNGYWKATGADKEVILNGKKIGCKKTLVFYEGKPPRGFKTNWAMHEYILSDNAPVRVRHGKEDMKLDNWVLCRLYKNRREEKQKRRITQEGNGLECQEKVEPHKMAEPVSEPNNMVAPPVYDQYEQLEVQPVNMSIGQHPNWFPELDNLLPVSNEYGDYYMFGNNPTHGGGFQVQQAPSYDDFVTNAAAAAPAPAPLCSTFHLDNQFQSMGDAGFNLPPPPLQFQPRLPAPLQFQPHLPAPPSPPLQFSGVDDTDFDFSVDEYLSDPEFDMPPP
ncbi:NAC domain protein NAC77 [Gossypium australe]|uniref:NAC domain protein NAC77 n=1 Tax=Gossypium australe TaxID=47621 RepID=A0A5B6WJL3_9ROSI|nr:NAC domain protein NAC77 [Gossypium australe]